MSFRIKSSHKFVNPSTEESTPQSSYLDYSLSSTTSSATTKVTHAPGAVPKTTSDTDVVSGSAKGMAVRTSVTAMADYF